MYFRDRDELLASGIHDILASVPSAHPKVGAERNESILWFSLPIFEHIERHRRSGEFRLGPRGRAILRTCKKVLAELIVTLPTLAAVSD